MYIVKVNGAVLRGGCAWTLLVKIAKQKEVLLDQGGREKKEDSPFQRRRRQGIIQMTKVICYHPEGWKAAWVVGQRDSS